MRKYIDMTSQFNAMPYDADLYAAILRQAGAKVVRKARIYGWANQPRVVTYAGDSIHDDAVRIALSRLPEFSDGRSVIIRQKDW